MAISTDSFEPAPRVVSGASSNAREDALERALRPKMLDDYVGLV